MMFNISRLKLRNFKSFKAADAQLSDTFVCFAGPNGSGKSNLCDAIRFVMGEKSLRSLRAKKVKDLIYAGAKTAEVSLVFGNGGDQLEIKRVIRQDGKILYRLNGKRTTRGAILEALKKHNLDGSGRNTIAQGEVQRIISMNGKERRLIIDNVAGIADFEEKKKEAMRELETVETRIKDAKLVLGERKAFLRELEKEKEIAIKYRDSRKTLTNAKGTLLKIEIDRHEKDLEGVIEKEEKMLSERRKIEEDMGGINKIIDEVEIKRHETSQELQSKQKTNAMIRRLEELKASGGSKKQLIEDRQKFIENAKEEKKTIETEISEENEIIKGLELEVKTLQEELAKVEAKLASYGGTAEDKEIIGLRREIYECEQDLLQTKEKLMTTSSEIESKGELIKAKREEYETIAISGSNDGGASEDVSRLKAEADGIAAKIERSFAKTKEVNNQIAELDREMLELKEKASIYKIRASPKLANPALSLISEMKEPGIYGILADLISFDPTYASAVEAAGGGRLLYIVVDSIDTATGVIEKLKKAKAGRATFIPIDSIKTAPVAKEGRYSSILDVVDCKAAVRRAVEYVFADTLLVDNVHDAKKIGTGKTRMVTLEGEIFERSGIVSGGRAQSSILSANQLRKIETDLADVKSHKDALIQELYAIREDESKMRAEKSQLEIRVKTLEMKQTLADERKKETETALKRKERLANEIKELENGIKNKITEREKCTVLVSEKQEILTKAREKMEAAEKEFKKSTEESSKERADLSGEVSEIRTKNEGKRSEIKLREKECQSKKERLERLNKEEKEALVSIKNVNIQIKEEQKELLELEGRISSASKAIEKLFERMRGYENELQELGERRGEKRMMLDKLNKDLNQLEIKKATTTTRLEDIKAEFSEFTDIEFMDAERDELSRMIGESERTLAELGNVNMAAVEMYDKRKAEIEDVEDRIGKLDSERGAIISMIDEIEEHKKEAFFETFHAVNDNFTKLFDHINIGKGHLYLNNPSDPFESGLFIKLRRNNQEHSLDALSGGEKTLVALMFMFALQFFKPAPFYILDEVDAALDKPNSKNLANLIMKTKESQFIMVTHNDILMSNSDAVIGVTKSGDMSKLVGIRIKVAA
ncbi:chromosome segregation protein SMC [Candidatus Micrarchaeota archaeon]|nr:chromosome segregation protein SMC [Candidatus Micrarchaeota archaeon]